MTEDVGLLINSSRGIIYKSQDEDFAQASRTAAKELQSQMEVLLNAR